MKYIIKNTKFNNYYHSNLCEGYHFVLDKEEAHICQNKWEANRIVKQFKSKGNFEILEVKHAKKNR